MINDPAMTQEAIVTAINVEAGKKVISKSAFCRFVQSQEKITGTKRGKPTPTANESLGRIAIALERIAFFLEK
jgi:hypothetical protein